MLDDNRPSRVVVYPLNATWAVRYSNALDALQVESQQRFEQLRRHVNQGPLQLFTED